MGLQKLLVLIVLLLFTRTSQALFIHVQSYLDVADGGAVGVVALPDLLQPQRRDDQRSARLQATPPP